MKKLELVCSYEDWKNKIKEPFGLTEDDAKLLSLGFNFNRTKEQEAEYQKIRGRVDQQSIDRKYTKITYEITDLYNDLKYMYDEKKRKETYTQIGKKQCEVEVLKEKYK